MEQISFEVIEQKLFDDVEWVEEHFVEVCACLTRRILAEDCSFSGEWLQNTAKQSPREALTGMTEGIHFCNDFDLSGVLHLIPIFTSIVSACAVKSRKRRSALRVLFSSLPTLLRLHEHLRDIPSESEGISLSPFDFLVECQNIMDKHFSEVIESKNVQDICEICLFWIYVSVVLDLVLRFSLLHQRDGPILVPREIASLSLSANLKCFLSTLVAFPSVRTDNDVSPNIPWQVSFLSDANLHAYSSTTAEEIFQPLLDAVDPSSPGNHRVYIPPLPALAFLLLDTPRSPASPPESPHLSTTNLLFSAFSCDSAATVQLLDSMLLASKTCAAVNAMSAEVKVEGAEVKDEGAEVKVEGAEVKDEGAEVKELEGFWQPGGLEEWRRIFRPWMYAVLNGICDVRRRAVYWTQLTAYIGRFIEGSSDSESGRTLRSAIEILWEEVQSSPYPHLSGSLLMLAKDLLHKHTSLAACVPTLRWLTDSLWHFTSALISPLSKRSPNAHSTFNSSDHSSRSCTQHPSSGRSISNTAAMLDFYSPLLQSTANFVYFLIAKRGDRDAEHSTLSLSKSECVAWVQHVLLPLRETLLEIAADEEIQRSTSPEIGILLMNVEEVVTKISEMC